MQITAYKREETIKMYAWHTDKRLEIHVYNLLLPNIRTKTPDPVWLLLADLMLSRITTIFVLLEINHNKKNKKVES